ncbi:HAD-IIIC family phosphatase [Kutzneria kofuensis]|uniref:FkbH-like protein n=1 Tax=Kutzneria kofuensis TaxID=103725 RepID=A0A7W9KPH8_9PSEU|nr:HAD-IIIC family phosphatase [Kutzneria kofuensis]MBB5896353.1 FkbH-like protein [Kutzneria kofuensis]
MTTLKCVIWDLDDTLWRGTLAEGDDVVPDAAAIDLVDRLERAGVVQSVASRNDHDQAERRLAEIGLADRFVYPEISWSAKSAAVRRIVSALNIGSDTVVFLDDSEFERAEVSVGNPGVRCHTLAEFLELDGAHGLVPSGVTPDAARRPAMYRDEQRRRAAEAEFHGPPGEFLASLEMTLTVRAADRADLDRAAELTERTNQLNTTGTTYSVEELAALGARTDREVLIAELTDRFGDYGRVGLAVLRREPGVWTVDLLLVSCRVMGRNIGSALFGVIAQRASHQGVALRVRYVPNGRNRQMRIVCSMLGFQPVPGDGPDVILEHQAPGSVTVPDYLKLGEAS